MDKKKTGWKGRSPYPVSLFQCSSSILLLALVLSFFSSSSLFKCPFFFPVSLNSLALVFHSNSLLPPLFSHHSCISCSPFEPHILPPALSTPLLLNYLSYFPPISPLSRSSPSFHLNPSSPLLPVRLCVPCHSPCCPRLKHMALSSLLLSSINTVVGGNYRHIAQHVRLCSCF